MEIRISGTSEEMRAVLKNVCEAPSSAGSRVDDCENHVATSKTNEWRRFEPLTEDPAELEKLNRMLFEKNITRQDLALILFSLRVRPEFGKKDFGI